jgi:peptidoglycan/LPS O-acetylase OafA/YrhL
MTRAGQGGRLAALDATRGVLACVVVVHHVVRAFGSLAMARWAHMAVLGFFLMSGYVLAYSYDGRPLVFMARRVVRLWPLYAVCVCAGCAVQGLALNPTWLVWWPMPPFQEGAVFDPPAWSLFMEAWATLIFPVLFWVTLRGRIFGMALAGLSFALIYVEPRLFCVPFFAIGVAATGFAINWPRRAPAMLLWLGKISYSLYLTHALVMIVAVRAFGSWGAIAVLPAVFGIAWLCWWAIERPSILLSRRVGATKRVAAQA